MKSDERKDNFLLEYSPKYSAYRFLMQERVNEVLLVSSIYDSFIIEEDARLSDQIFEEFHNLNLRTLPHISRASTVGQALKLLREQEFDLVITMRHLGDVNPWKFAADVKQLRDIPVFLLLNNATDLQYLRSDQTGSIDKVFVWNGNSTVFVAMIKLLEDRKNVDHDTEEGDVRVIIVVEDSVRFYSLYLPALYTEIMRQTHCLIHEGGHDYHSLLQMRSRPKILLASTYEQAIHDYQKYKDHLLGIITDIKFPRDGVLDEEAGFDLVRTIRADAPTLPIMLQSSDESNRERAENLSGHFVNKNDRALIHELRSFMLGYMGFGSFTFRLPNDEIVGVANSLFELHEVIEAIPIESLVYHAGNDHFSGWLAARGEFATARELKPQKVSDFDDPEDLRQAILAPIDLLLQERMGIIVDFDRQSFHPATRFVRLRPGSLGGKGRGIAFLLFLRSSFSAGFHKEFPDISIEIPKTYVIGTEEFEQFMQQNNLYDIAFSDVSDETIKERFVNARISETLRDDLKFIFESMDRPLAVRSSSIFEDSLYQPFAGVFATYMIPNCHPDVDVRIDQLVDAIKLVYASTYFKLARSYAETMGMSLAASRMAVVIQEVVGEQHGNRFYPNYAGVASSYNYYPLGDRLQPEDRIAYLVLGLGKAVVEGGLARRFSPKHPEINIFSSAAEKIKGTQRNFYAITRTHQPKIDLKKSENTFINKYNLRDAIQDGTLREIADTYQHIDDTFSSGFWDHQEGYPVITFDRQLKYGTFPLAQVINRVLILGEKAMGCPVEIEFAGNFSKGDNGKPTFALLQLRPFMEHEETLREEVDVDRKDLFVYSTEISGNRLLDDIRDIVYVKPEDFDSIKTRTMAEEAKGINKKLLRENRPYILIGPGRWGTCDYHVGIPVDWTAINGARVIMEVDFPDFKVDHSQGSHFFHNITSAGIPYFYVKDGSESNFLDWEWLEGLELIEETPHFKHVRADSPLFVVVNGKKRQGQIVKPEAAKEYIE